MSNRSIFLFVSIALLAGGILFFLPTDEKQIQENLDTLATHCSTSRGDSIIESLTKASAASKLCTSPCRINIESRKISKDFKQKEISDNILIVKKRLPDTTFNFEDTHIELPTKTQANVITTLRLNGSSAEGQFTDAYEVDITLKKIDGDWLFSSFTIVEFMVK